MIGYIYPNVNYRKENVMYNRKKHIKTQDVVELYTIQHLSSCEIQKLIGMSRPAIMKRLKRAGVTIDQGEWVNTICDFCGIKYKLVRSRWRKTKDHYCKAECYYASRENPGYHPWRQGQRLARAIVAQYFNFSQHPNAVIHHKDGDDRNNNRDNLAVYTSNSDHIKATHHNNHNIKPLWDGANS